MYNEIEISTALKRHSATISTRAKQGIAKQQKDRKRELLMTNTIVFYKLIRGRVRVQYDSEKLTRTQYIYILKV